MADWKCGADRTLPLASDTSWDGPAAEKSIFAWAGFDGDHPDAAKAKRGFLCYDASDPTLKGSYKLPFALVEDGDLKASPAGIRAAASRLPQADIPDSVQSKARAVLDAYEKKMGAEKDAADGDEDDQDDEDARDTHREDRRDGDMDKGADRIRHKEAMRGQIKAMTPDEGEMAAINQYSLKPLTAEDIFVHRMKLANTQYDRDDERFPKEYLDRFAQTLPGKSLMRRHDYSTEPVGRFHAAEVRPEPDGSGHYLLASAYMDANHPMVDSIQKGISHHVSIGFVPDSRTCDLCGKDYDGWQSRYLQPDSKMDGEEGGSAAMDEEPCRHIVGQMYGGKKCTLTYGGDLSQVEALEGSHVWLGAQHGATTVRSASGDARKAKWLKSVGSLLGRAGGSKEGVMDDKALAAAKARERELQQEIDRLRPLAEDGESYRDWQKAEILRLHASLGEEATGKALVKALDAADAKTLDEVRKEVDKRHGEAFAQGSGQMGGSGKEFQPGTSRSLTEIMFGAAARRGGES